MSVTVCLEAPLQALNCKRRKADTQVITDSRQFVREDIWTADDFPTEIDTDFAVTHAQYQSLKHNWLGSAVKPRDPRVTDKVLRSWGMRSWKQYVLDRYLTNY
ncbi:TPA: hypothetical protein ACH3X1_003634 [Trebouxia sp. C0004]